MKNPINFLDRLIERIISRVKGHGEDLFHIARIRLNLRLTAFFLFGGFVYSIAFWWDGFHFLALLALVSAVSLLTIPLVLLYPVKPIISQGVYIVFGFGFASINIFGSGELTGSVTTMLWLIFIAHLAYAILPRKVAIAFSLVVFFLFMVKRSLLDLGVDFPYLIDVAILASPRSIDIAIPIVFNIFIAYTSHNLYEQAKSHLTRAHQNVVRLGERVKDSESRYQFIVEKGMGYMSIHKLDDQILFMNPASCNAIGYSNEELNKMNIVDILDKSVVYLFHQAMEIMTLVGNSSGIMKVRTRMGAVLYWDFRSALVRDGSDYSVIGFAQDVTELIATRKQVEQQARLLETLVASSNDIVLVFDEEEELVQCWVHLAELPDSTSLIGKRPEDVFPKIFKNAAEEALNSFRISRLSLASSEMVIASMLNDRQIWLRARMLPVITGNRKFISVHITDVSKLREKEELERIALQKSNLFKSTLADLSLADLSSEETVSDNIAIICSAAAHKLNLKRVGLWLYQESNIESIYCLVQFDSGQVNKFSLPNSSKLTKSQYPRYFEALKEGKTIIAHDAESDIRTSEFKNGYLDLIGIASMLDVPVYHAGKIIGVICLEHCGDLRSWDNQEVGFAESISTLCSLVFESHKRKSIQIELELHAKRLEEAYAKSKEMGRYLAYARSKAEESDQLKSLFLANFGHEIRTPMTAILGFSELLERPNLSPEKRLEFTRYLRERSNDLLKIITNVLDISKIESGQVFLEVEKGNVDELLDRVIKLAQTETMYLRNRHISFKKANQLIGRENEVTIDFGKTGQVLNNLVNNAIKFSSQGAIEISCQLLNGKMLQFAVKDEGIGIQEEKIESLFRPFRQADEGIHKKFGGSGLGLAICKGLVEVMGGKIGVVSELNVGSEFTFTVALRDFDTMLKLQEKSKLLLICTRDLNFTRTMMLLRNHGFEFLTCETPNQVNEILHLNPSTKILIIDVEDGGHYSVELLQLMETKLPLISLIVLANSLNQEVTNLMDQLGAATLLTKPITYKKLIGAINQATPLFR